MEQTLEVKSFGISRTEPEKVMGERVSQGEAQNLWTERRQLAFLPLFLPPPLPSFFACSSPHLVLSTLPTSLTFLLPEYVQVI